MSYYVLICFLLDIKLDWVYMILNILEKNYLLFKIMLILILKKVRDLGWRYWVRFSILGYKGLKYEIEL